MWNKHSRRLFWAGVLPASLLLSQMIIYVLHLAAGFKLHFNLFELCSSIVRRYGLLVAVHALDAVVITTLLTGGAMVLYQLIVSRRAMYKLHRAKDDKLTKLYNSQFGGGKLRLVIIGHDAPAAFTFGFFRPVIVLSTGMLQLLDEEELEAVILHEQYHQSHADPLKTYVLFLFSQTLWYLPILGWVHQQYKLVREVLADQYALQRQGSPAGLSSALVKLLRRGRPQQMAFAHVSFADTGINVRIRQLLDPHDQASFKLPITRAAISAHVVIVLFVMFYLACL
ncbi:Zn-dependent protease with chaperone function [Paenibacillus phyllosphaerae]|uniref:Zn-dependent protease with chaperone function n=1 Tax=Paenibacillus phyllosphaerae TaxID=274593 RepID=A0A7W5B174_9BACL|nr:M56 family metallopeptidase [Paenibacillus phyllosphaerae]MBB3112239.1 Zn-dependent protease with chaperone function [Paenibacillus phyllosphaerae]